MTLVRRLKIYNKCDVPTRKKAPPSCASGASMYGFSYIEVIFSVAILSVCATALMFAFSSIINSYKHSKESFKAAMLCENILEETHGALSLLTSDTDFAVDPSVFEHILVDDDFGAIIFVKRITPGDLGTVISDADCVYCPSGFEEEYSLNMDVTIDADEWMFRSEGTYSDGIAYPCFVIKVVVYNKMEHLELASLVDIFSY